MWKTFTVPISQRAIVLRHGLPQAALGPGRHTVWGTHLDVERYDVETLLLVAPAEVRAILPADWFAEVTFGARERGVLEQDGRPQIWLTPGMYRYWTVDPTVRLHRISLDEPPDVVIDMLGDQLRPPELERVIVPQHGKGLLYVQGRFERVLEPGRHLFWSDDQRTVSVHVVDMRRQILNVAGQELMTADKVTLRLSLAVQWAPLDPATHAHVAASATDSLYALVQLAVREYVAAVSLDELLEGREALSNWLGNKVLPEAARFGVGVERVGVKDIILPGDMKHLLNRVIEATKQAEAGVILRKEEAAATRAQANAAQLMAERPALLRLKELEALESIASHIDDLRVVVGGEHLARLIPALGDSDRGDNTP